MLAYKNDPKLKRGFVREIEKHRKADQIEQGHYGKENGIWKGCAVACSLRSLAILDGEALQTKYGDHALYESKLGIPEWLARLEDRIFEGLPVKDAKKWPSDFAKAIPVGANLESVKWRFSAFLLKENIERVLALDINDGLKTLVVDAIRKVLAVHSSAIKTGQWDESAAWSAASAARSAARSAESAAESAARSAESAAESAARSAARSAESAAYKRYARELLHLLAKAK